MSHFARDANPQNACGRRLTTKYRTLRRIVADLCPRARRPAGSVAGSSDLRRRQSLTGESFLTMTDAVSERAEIPQLDVLLAGSARHGHVTPCLSTINNNGRLWTRPREIGAPGGTRWWYARSGAGSALIWCVRTGCNLINDGAASCSLNPDGLTSTLPRVMLTSRTCVTLAAVWRYSSRRLRQWLPDTMSLTADVVQSWTVAYLASCFYRRCLDWSLPLSTGQ